MAEVLPLQALKMIGFDWHVYIVHPVGLKIKGGSPHAQVGVYPVAEAVDVKF